MNPAADLLRALTAELERLGRPQVQHLRPEYLAAEAKRLADAWDSVETSKQLAKYGVPMYDPTQSPKLGD
jgi:hypothetical protein